MPVLKRHTTAEYHIRLTLDASLTGSPVTKRRHRAGSATGDPRPTGGMESVLGPANAQVQRLRVFGAEADPSVDAERVCLVTLEVDTRSSSAEGGAVPPSPAAAPAAATQREWMFYQNLKHSLFGSVKAAVLLARQADGSLRAVADAQKVAVKVTEKARLLREPRQEDPLHEIEILRALHPPGHRCANVAALAGDFFDENYLFVLLEFADGGALVSPCALGPHRDPPPSRSRAPTHAHGRAHSQPSPLARFAPRAQASCSTRWLLRVQSLRAWRASTCATS